MWRVVDNIYRQTGQWRKLMDVDDGGGGGDYVSNWTVDGATSNTQTWITWIARGGGIDLCHTSFDTP